jgi:thiol-disulfide isomerase/thioredoxin
VDIRKVGDQECISCGECVKVCPTQAISWKGPKILTQKREKSKTQQLVSKCLVTVLLLDILVGVFVYYWRTTPDLPEMTDPTEFTSDTLQVGTEVGNLCPGAELAIVDGSGETGEHIDPSKLGKVTVINFWGTWCTPCVNELPYFDQVATEYADSVTVVAVHSLLANNTMAAYIGEHYPDTNMVFVTDYGTGNTSEYYTVISDGGAAGYPYTVVLDENGVITGVFPSTLEYESLKAAVEEALQ